MKKSILKLNGIQELKSSSLKKIKGGNVPTEQLHSYTCWDDSGDYQSNHDVSGEGTTCVLNSVTTTVVVGPR